MTTWQWYIAEFCVLASITMGAMAVGGHPEPLIFYVGSIALRILYGEKL